MVLSKLMPAGTFGAKPGTFGDQIKEMTFCLLLAHCAVYNKGAGDLGLAKQSWLPFLHF